MGRGRGTELDGRCIGVGDSQQTTTPGWAPSYVAHVALGPMEGRRERCALPMTGVLHI